MLINLLNSSSNSRALQDFQESDLALRCLAFSPSVLQRRVDSGSKNLLSILSDRYRNTEQNRFPENSESRVSCLGM